MQIKPVKRESNFIENMKKKKTRLAHRTCRLTCCGTASGSQPEVPQVKGGRTFSSLPRLLLRPQGARLELWNTVGLGTAQCFTPLLPCLGGHQYFQMQSWGCQQGLLSLR